MGIRESINAGYPQHAAIVFDGRMDIIGNERILLEDGFTLTQTYCAEENLIPGSIANDHFTARLINQDSALTGFNFERNAMLLLGVEDGDPVNEQSSAVVISGTKAKMKLYGIDVIFAGGYLDFYNGSTRAYRATTDAFTSIRKSAGDNPDYEVYVTAYTLSGYVFSKRINVSYDGTVQATDLSGISISEYAYKRLRNMNDAGVCECWDFASAMKYSQWTLIAGNVERADVLYVVKSAFKGQKPRSTSDLVVDFTATTDFTFLDKNADAYAKIVWGSSKTLGQMFCEVTGNSIFSSGLLPQNVDSIVFQTNPFSGIEGLTYREMTSYICAACGLIATQHSDFDVTNDMTFNIYSYFQCITIQHLSKGNTADLTLTKDEYYSYSAADFTVHKINEAEWEQIYPVSGAYVGGQSTGDGSTNPLTYRIVGNPIMDYSPNSITGTLLTRFFDNVKESYFGNYKPCEFESHLGTLINPGDTIKITKQNGTTVWMPVFVVTITWNGSADCVVESTGAEWYNQDNDPTYKALVQNANVAYRVADNAQPNSSSYLVKKHIQNLEDPGAMIDRLRPVSFQYRFDSEEKTHYGLVFEEVKETLPVICRDDPDPVKKKLNYNELIPILLAEVQHLRARVKELEEGN